MTKIRHVQRLGLSWTGTKTRAPVPKVRAHGLQNTLFSRDRGGAQYQSGVVPTAVLLTSVQSCERPSRTTGCAQSEQIEDSMVENTPVAQTADVNNDYSRRVPALTSITECIVYR